MPLFGKIVVIKKNGTDGTHFPLTRNSCLFGRKRECDIRIQLPQVSKEHCKIEVNENKEATLFNLSPANPTELNGNIFQQPTFLKHGDVFTIIDRSFRFEYPPSLLPRKRSSRSQENETLQVLHVQQQEEQEELLHHRNSESKSPQISEKKLAWENRNTNECDETKTQEFITGQYGTPQSTYKTFSSERKNEMSPFSKLYELAMKQEHDTKIAEKDVSNETFVQSKEHLARKDGNDTLEEAASQIPHRISETGQIKKTEDVIWNELEHSRYIKSKEINRVISNPISVERKRSRRSSLGLQGYAAEQKQESEGTNKLNLQNAEENELDRTEVIKNASNDTGLTASRQSAKYFLESCSIVSLEHADRAGHPEKSEDEPTKTAGVEIKANLIDTCRSVESILSIPKSNRESFQTYSSPCSRKPRRSSKSRMQQVDSLIELKNSTETSSEIEECSMNVSAAEPDFVALTEKGKNEVLAIEPMQTLKATNEICMNNTQKDRNSGTIASSFHCCNSKSPRRSIKQNEDFLNGHFSTEQMHINSEESLEVHGDTSGTGCMCTPNQPPEKEGNWLQKEEDKIKEPTMKVHKQNFDNKNYIPGHESNVPVPAEGEAASELNVTSAFSVKRKSVKKSPKMQKDEEPDILIQPLGKRKRVSFGGHLSPELFDKRLPPNSPLKRGATPARLSLPFGNSSRAVLKKALEFRQSQIKSFPERVQHENISSKNAASPAGRRSPVASPAARRSPVTSPATRRSPVASPAAHRSPVASPAAHRSPVASPAARRSPVASPATRRSPVASPATRRSPVASPATRRSPVASPATRRSPVASPAARKSPVASPAARKSPVASPPATFSFNAPQRRGRFSVSHVTNSPSEEQDALSSQMNGDEEFTEVKTSEPTVEECKAARSTKRSKKASPRRSSLCRRSGVMGVIHSRRQSGASKANLIVAKSWADIVKQGVPKSQVSSAAKCALKRSAKKRSAKKSSTKPSKNNVSMLKTPIRKVKGHFTTGHANSPAPIVIGKAHTSIVNVAVQVPKVMMNYPLKKHDDLNESFTGLAEIFNTPLNGLPSSAQKTTIPTPEVVSEMHTPEESGEMSVSPFSAGSQQKLYNQDVISPFLKEVSQISALEQDYLTTTPKGMNSSLEKDVEKNMSLVTAANEATIQGVMEDKRKGPEQKLEPVETFSGVKRVLRTPKQKPEPVDALSGVKRVLRTPKQKPEPVDALSGVKRVLRTPKQKPEPVDALSGVKRLLRTPKQKPEPVDALSGVKRLLRTPKEILQSVAVDTVCPKFIMSPEETKQLMGSSTRRKQRMPLVGYNAIDTTINHVIKAPKEKGEAVEDMGGIQRLLRTPKQRFEPMDDMVGISRLLKTPKQKFMPVDDYLGLQRFMTEPKQSFPSPEVDYTGVKEMLETADGQKAELPEFVNLMKEDNGSCMSSRESMRNDYENKKAKLESSPKRISPFPKPNDNSKNISELEDNLGHVACNTISELKSEAVIEPVEIMCVSESHPPKGLDSENGHKIDFVKEPAANSGAVDIEIVGPLASARRTRRGEADESRSIKEHDTKNTQRLTSSTQRAESVNCVQAIANFDQNITEINLKQESESSTSAVESEGKMAPRQTEASLDLEENAEIQDKTKQDFESSGVESAGNVIHKRNRRGKAASIQAELFTTNTDVNEAKKESLRHTPKTHVLEKTATEVKENNVRRRKGRRVHFLCDNSVPLEEKRMLGDKDGAYEEQKSASIASQSGMQEIQNEENPNEVQKVPLESVQTPGKHSPPRRQTVAPRRGRSKRAISQQTTIECDSKQAADIKDQNMLVTVKENQPKRGRGRRAVPECQIPPLLENVALTKESPTVDSFSSTQGKCSLQEIQTEKNLDEMPKMPLESEQSLLEHSPPKRQKIAKGNPPGRGRSKQTNYPKIPTECDSKQAADTEDQNMPVTVKENQPKRGRGRRAVPVCSVTLPLEDIALTYEDPTANSISSAPGKCSLDEIQNEEKPNETEKVHLEGLQTPARKQKVANRMLPKRGKSKQAISQETFVECESKQTADRKDQAMVVTIKDNELKRGRRRVVPVSHRTLPLGNITLAYEGATVDSFSSSQGKCSLQEIQTEENLDVLPIMPLESVQPLLEHSPPKKQKTTKENPPRRGRSKQTISPEIPTECDSKQAADTEDQNMLVTVKENQPKRGRGRRAVPECQIPLHLENVALKKERPTVGSFSSTQGKCSLQDIQSEKNLDEMSKMPLESVQPLLEHTPPKKQKATKGNPPRRGRSKQTISPEIPTECDSKQAAGTEDQNMLVTVKENQPKRGRGRRTVPECQIPLPLENVALKKESPTVDNFSSSQGKCSLQEIQTEENLDEMPKMPLESVQPLLEHSPQKRQKIAKGNPPRRGRNKQTISPEILTECDRKQAGDTEDQNMLVTVKENQLKRGRQRKIAHVTALSPLKNNILPLPSSTKSKGAVEQPSEALEIATVASENLPRRGRKRKVDEVIAASSVSASGKPILLDTGNQEDMPEVLKGVTIDNVSKRGRRKQSVPSEISTESNGQPGSDNRKASFVKDNKMPLESSSVFKNQSKGKRTTLSRVHPSLKVSITLTSPPPDKGETASENQSTLLENDAIGKGKLEKCGRRNKNKIGTASTSLRRKPNHPEQEDFQEKQNVDFGKLSIANEKISRRGRKVYALEAPISASLRNNRRLNAGGDNAPKDRQMILKNKSKSKAALKRHH
ncbi:proliferation marker protein Ki-67 isoform X2 [Zootoca vivipara]|uniref:proliferation marker protein Ki-67 isoform X2 n=1 Tax=Zootoca vivipara TaxID=8524 RepID=UPI001591EA9E|nr:proliferation marker protein Ki-67 isoform X2 [Zootoca vivipara]